MQELWGNWDVGSGWPEATRAFIWQRQILQANVSFVKLLNVNVPTLQGYKRLWSEKKKKSQKPPTRLHKESVASPVVPGIFNGPTSTAIVMHSSVNLQVQHLQVRHLQLQSTTWQKNLEVRRKFKRKRKNPGCSVVVFFPLSVVIAWKTPWGRVLLAN